jgi:hypothetical protein
MQVLILCGGRGSRLNGEHPKPLIEIGGRPILWHVMLDGERVTGFREKPRAEQWVNGGWVRKWRGRRERFPRSVLPWWRIAPPEQDARG